MKNLLATIVLSLAMPFTLTLSSAFAGPCFNDIMPANPIGAYQQNGKYTIEYDHPSFGGHWVISGRIRENKDGTYEETFRGTVTDNKLKGTFTRNDMEWMSDGLYLCMYHEWIPCTSFSMTISDGNVVGYGTSTDK
jgi:hypothetical protein